MPDAYNKFARADYDLLEKYEAGLVLTGQEVKAIKNNQLNLKGAYVTLKSAPNPEFFLINAHISPYKYAGPLPHYNPTQSRKLLLTKKEIRGLVGKVQAQGLTLIPLKVYTQRNLLKLEFALARGRKKFEKREQQKKKETDKQIRQALKSRA